VKCCATPIEVLTTCAIERTNVKNLLKMLLGTSLFLLEQSDHTKSVRDRAATKINDLRDAVQQKYEGAADRVAKASRAIRGEDNHSLGNTLRLAAAGIGVGIGAGLLLAPASGQQTRRAIARRVQQFGNKVRKQVFSEHARATATAS
jgi:gas vesicle protein